MKVPINLISLIAILLLSPVLLFAQHGKGTVAESWETASPAPAEQAPGVSVQKTKAKQSSDTPAWSKQRSAASRSWPSLPKNASGGDYFKANNMAIDSLARLYCLSSNYIETLRKRNEQAAGAGNKSGTSLRDFNYNDGAAVKGSDSKGTLSNKSSLQVIYKELNALLERCLHGR